MKKIMWMYLRNRIIIFLRKFTWIRWPPENKENEEQNQRNQMNPMHVESVAWIAISLPYAETRIGNWKKITSGSEIVLHWWSYSLRLSGCSGDHYAAMIVGCWTESSLLHFSTREIEWNWGNEDVALIIGLASINFVYASLYLYSVWFC